MKSKLVFRKSLDIKVSGRSTDFISPSFVNECAYECSYCYVKRHNAEYITIAKNNGDILTAINHHLIWLPDKEPNQTHETYYTYDIGCNSDIALHAKQLNWKYIFDFFKNEPRAMGSFATKYVNKDLLSYNPEGKIRIRFSLMPQFYADKLEPRTSSIAERLSAVKLFREAGYDVHLNFSPVIIDKRWLSYYQDLFLQVLKYAKFNNWNNDSVKCEVIFLTHNENKHFDNLKNNLLGEDLLWKPELQEFKKSQYGGRNIRYKYQQKAEYIKEFKALHESIIPWCTIRYIF